MRMLLAAVNLALSLAISSCRMEDSPWEEGSAGVGSIEGVVLWAGEEVPKPTRVENETDPEVCGRVHALDDLVVAPEGRGIRNAIVALVDVPEKAIPRVEPGRLVLDNTGCRFSPHAAVSLAGSTLEAFNGDPILHTTHLYGPAELNVSLPVKGARSARQLDRPGLYLVRCDIHGWMQAVVRVDVHPFHAVTDERGAFRIDGVPEGRYRLEVWHEKLGSQETEVAVEGGTTAAVKFEYP